MFSTTDTGLAPQVTYLPRRHCFAVWQRDSTRTATTATTPIELTLPNTGGSVAVRTVEAQLVEPRRVELEAALAPSAGLPESASARGWLAVLDHLEHRPHYAEIPASLLESLPRRRTRCPTRAGPACRPRTVPSMPYAPACTCRAVLATVRPLSPRGRIRCTVRPGFRPSEKPGVEEFSPTRWGWARLCRPFPT